MLNKKIEVTILVMATPANTIKDLMEEFETAFEECIKLLTDLNESEDSGDVGLATQRFLDFARQMEAFFLQKRLLLSTHKPEELVQDETHDMMADLARKEDLIRKFYEKMETWKNILPTREEMASVVEENTTPDVENEDENEAEEEDETSRRISRTLYNLMVYPPRPTTPCPNIVFQTPMVPMMSLPQMNPSVVPMFHHYPTVMYHPATRMIRPMPRMLRAPICPFHGMAQRPATQMVNRPATHSATRPVQAVAPVRRNYNPTDQQLVSPRMVQPLRRFNPIIRPPNPMGVQRHRELQERNFSQQSDEYMQ